MLCDDAGESPTVSLPAFAYLREDDEQRGYKKTGADARNVQTTDYSFDTNSCAIAFQAAVLPAMPPAFATTPLLFAPKRPEWAQPSVEEHLVTSNSSSGLQKSSNCRSFDCQSCSVISKLSALSTGGLLLMDGSSRGNVVDLCPLDTTMASQEHESSATYIAPPDVGSPTLMDPKLRCGPQIDYTNNFLYGDDQLLPRTPPPCSKTAAWCSWNDSTSSPLSVTSQRPTSVAVEAGFTLIRKPDALELVAVLPDLQL